MTALDYKNLTRQLLNLSACSAMIMGAAIFFLNKPKIKPKIGPLRQTAEV